jgi:DNA processing protein
VIYPPENAALARAVAEHGALLSEFPPGTKPDAPNFPKRNRIVAGLCLGTLVTEAGDGSGALLTARIALDQNREVFAVPGSIFARGCAGTNSLIRQSGAKLVSAAAHILEELQLGDIPQQLAFRIETPDDPLERQVLALLTPEPQHIDQLTRQSGLPAHTVSATLTLLELKGAARQVGGLQYVRGL